MPKEVSVVSNAPLKHEYETNLKDMVWVVFQNHRRNGGGVSSQPNPDHPELHSGNRLDG